MIESSPLYCPNSNNVGPSVTFDIDLGKQIAGKMVEFDDIAYIAHLRANGLNDEQIAETSVRFRADHFWNTITGEYNLKETAITVYGLSNANKILGHETEHRVEHARNMNDRPDRRYF